MMRKKKSKFWDYGKGILVFIVLIIIAAIFSFSNGPSISGSQISVIPVRGVITLYGSDSLFDSGIVSATEVVKKIEIADTNPNVKAIIIEINSPGGTVVASKEISTAIENANKPVVAWMREKAASGGYWIAASCDRVVADEATITGSVGVIGSYLEFSDLMDEYGITYESLVSGKYKDTGSPFKKLTSSERALLLKKIDTINEMFIDHVAKSRDIEEGQVRAIATGEVFLGIEAYELGLVDELGSKAKAVAVAENLAGIEDSEVVVYERSANFLEKFVKGFTFQSYMIGRGIGDSMLEEGEGFELKS